MTTLSKVSKAHTEVRRLLKARNTAIDNLVARYDPKLLGEWLALTESQQALFSAACEDDPETMAAIGGAIARQEPKPADPAGNGSDHHDNLAAAGALLDAETGTTTVVLPT